MHAIGSGIMGNSEYLNETPTLTTTSQCIYNDSRPKLDTVLSQYVFGLELVWN